MVSAFMATNSLACGHVTVHLNIIERQFAEFSAIVSSDIKVYILPLLSFNIILPIFPFCFHYLRSEFSVCFDSGVDGQCILWVVD